MLPAEPRDDNLRGEIMKAIHLQKSVEKDGEILVTGLPCKKGQNVEMVLVIEPSTVPRRPPLTARRLRQSPVIGLWKDRRDIDDSTAYARRLREQAQSRQR